MKFNKTLIYYISIFLFFYFTLIIGFLYGEDSSGGAVYDFNIHLKTINFFSDSILNGLKNYNKYQNAHSPIFIIFLKYILCKFVFSAKKNIIKIKGSTYSWYSLCVKP